MYRLATVFGLASVRPPHRVYRVRRQPTCKENIGDGKYAVEMKK